MSEVGEYERLLRVITASELTSGLMMARYEHAVLARQTWERAVAEAGEAGRRVGVVDFSDAEDDVDMLARLAAGSVGVDVVFAVGLERLLVEMGAPRERTAAIVTLNFNRDLIGERVGKPIVLWLSYRGARAFALQAPDTFDVIQTTFEFPETVAQDGMRLSYDVLPEWMYSILPEEAPELEQRVRVLESLHDEIPSEAEAADIAASLAKLEFALGRGDEALAWADRAAQGFEASGDLENAAAQHIRRAEMYLRLGKWDEASLEIEKIQALGERSGSVSVRAGAAVGKANILMLRGQFDDALAALDEPAVKVGEDESAHWRATVLSHRSTILAKRGDWAEASRIILEEEVPLHEHLGRRRSRAVALNKVADIYLKSGRLDDALHLIQDEVLPAYSEERDVHGRLSALNSVCFILGNRGEYDEAVRMRREIVGEFWQLGDAAGEAIARANLAVLLFERGLAEDRSEIISNMQAAYKIAKELSMREVNDFATFLSDLGIDPNVE